MTLRNIKVAILFSLRHPRVRLGLIGMVFTSLVWVSIGLFYWLPTINALERAQAELHDRRFAIADEEFKAKLADASGLASMQMAQVEKKLDIAVTQTALVQNMAMLARRNNIKILSESYEEGRPKGGYAPLMQVIIVQAGYAELREFIAGVHQLPSLTLVQEAMLSRSSGSSVLKAQLRIVTYRRDSDLLK